MTLSTTYFCNTCFAKFTVTLDDVDSDLIVEYCPFCGGHDVEEYIDEDGEEFGE